MFLNSAAVISVLAYAKKYSEILEEVFFNDKDYRSFLLRFSGIDSKVKIAVSEDMKRPLKGLQNW